MSYTAKQLIAVAEAELGYLEKETNSQLDNKTANAGDENWTKYARDLHKAGYYQANKNGYAWCDVFVDWCHYMASGKDAKLAQEIICQTGVYGAGCVYSSRYYRKAGRFHTSPVVGDQIFFGTEGSENHTGIVYKVDKTKVYTIEGNTSGGVRRRSYSLGSSKIVGYGRPRYAAEDLGSSEVSKPESPAALEVDGLWGRDTTTRLQQVFNTTVDGEVSNQWAEYQEENPGLVSGFEWEARPNGKGSQLIKAMQKWADMPAKEQDGEIGPKTITAFQKKLGTTQDGYVSKPSQMVKALQAWINQQGGASNA